MIATDTTWKSKRRHGSKEESVSDVAIEKKASNNLDNNVSVFTKTTAPKVIIQSEKIDATQTIQNMHRHRALKSICLIVLGIIILMTFFLTLKTYNSVNELYQLFSSITN